MGFRRPLEIGLGEVGKWIARRGDILEKPTQADEEIIVDQIATAAEHPDEIERRLFAKRALEDDADPVFAAVGPLLQLGQNAS